MLLVKPILGCDLNCKYCYEHDEGLLKSEKSKTKADIESIKENTKYWKDYFGGKDKMVLHGGEVLMLPIEELEELLDFCYNLNGGEAQLQTNGNLITDEHIKLFKKYNVGLGISFDGFGELNHLRGYPDLDRTIEYTDRLTDTIYKMHEEEISIGFISVLHQGNVGTDEKLEKFIEFLETFNERGIRGGRINLCYIDGNSPEIELSQDRAAEVYERLAEYVMDDPNRRLQPFREMADNLLGYGIATCTFSKCEPFQAPAGRVILPDGELATCVRHVDEEGNPVPYDESKWTGRHDFLLRHQCRGCRFWKICYGGCPGRPRNGSYMNKDYYCKAIFMAYKKIEQRMRGAFPHIQLSIDNHVPAQDEYGDYLNRSNRTSSFNPFYKIHSQHSAYNSSFKE